MEEAQDSTLASVLAPAAMALPLLPGALTSEDTVATELGEEIWSPEDCGRPSGSRDQETNKTHIENRVITNFPLPTMASPLFENDEEGAAYLLELIRKMCADLGFEDENGCVFDEKKQNHYTNLYVYIL